eukprot:GHVU01163995.1.p2 GENE.GHVU01163995.1~~GHVU01163995.1.p2  ORF type:complete len:112 (-),score=7.70 GHVU01163995.1:217-552(-)
MPLRLYVGPAPHAVCMKRPPTMLTELYGEEREDDRCGQIVRAGSGDAVANLKSVCFLTRRSAHDNCFRCIFNAASTWPIPPTVEEPTVSIDGSCNPRGLVYLDVAASTYGS